MEFVPAKATSVAGNSVVPQVVVALGGSAITMPVGRLSIKAS